MLKMLLCVVLVVLVLFFFFPFSMFCLSSLLGFFYFMYKEKINSVYSLYRQSQSGNRMFTESSIIDDIAKFIIPPSKRLRVVRQELIFPADEFKLKETKVYDKTLLLAALKNIKTIRFTDEEVSQRKALLIIGKSGNGKSTLGNILCGEDLFLIGHTPSSETSSILCHFSQKLNCFVIDTIGLGDNTGISDQEIVSRIITFLFLNKLVISAVILIDRSSDIDHVRVDPSVLNILTSFRDHFGYAIFRKFVLLVKGIPNNQQLIQVLTTFNQKLGHMKVPVDINKALSFLLQDEADRQIFSEHIANLLDTMLHEHPFVLALATKSCKECGLILPIEFNQFPCMHHEQTGHIGNPTKTHRQLQTARHGREETISDINFGQVVTSVGGFFASLVAIVFDPPFGVVGMAASAIYLKDAFRNKNVCSQCGKSTNEIGCILFYGCCSTDGCIVKCSKCLNLWETNTCINFCSRCKMKELGGCILEHKHNFN